MRCCHNNFTVYITFTMENLFPLFPDNFILILKSIESRLLQARSKQCLIGPAITKLSAGDLGAG